MEKSIYTREYAVVLRLLQEARKDAGVTQVQLAEKLGLTQSLGTAVFVLIWIVGIHQLEANVLNPKIMGDSAKIHPVLVIFSLLVGEHFFQIAGALLAVPCMSIAQSFFLHFREVIQRSDPEFAATIR